MNAAGLAQSIEIKILNGTYAAGARLPSTRDMSEQLGIAPGTVARAYRQLQERGLLQATTGRGTFVAGPSEREDLWDGDHVYFDNDLPEFSRAALTNRWLFESRASDGIQLMGGYGDVNKPLGQGLLRQMASERDAFGNRIAELQPADGADDPRTLIAKRLSQMMDHLIEPREIIFGNGAHTLLDMALRALTRPNDIILAEHPTYYGALDLFDAHRLKVIPISRGRDGLDLGALEAAIRVYRPKLFYFTGSPSTPRGNCLNKTERRELLGIIRRTRLPAIEDSSLWPFNLDSAPTRPLFANDETDSIIHICSFSKWFFPSLRFAVALGRSREFVRLRQINRGITRIQSAFPQFEIADYLGSATFEADLEASINEYRAARDELFDALSDRLPRNIVPQRPTAGFSLWIDLPGSVSTSQLYGQCTRHGVYPLPGKVFSLEDRTEPGLRLAFGQNKKRDLKLAAERVAKSIGIALEVPHSEPNRLIP